MCKAFWAAASLCLALGLPAQAQTTAVSLNVGNRPTCDCTLTLEPVATLTGDHVSTPSTLARDSRGRFYVAHIETRSELAVFSPTGEFERIVGRKGGGPGEFSVIASIEVGAGDSIHVIDSGNSRHSVLSPEGRFIRSVGLPLRPLPDGVVLSHDGGLIVAADIRSRDLVGYPLHRVKDGRIENSFGSTSGGAYRSDEFEGAKRRVAPAVGGGVWSSWRQRYRIEQWSPTGQLLRIVQREPPWFQPWNTPRQFADTIQPRMTDIGHISPTQLLVAVTVAADKWRERGAVTTTPDGTGWIPDDNAFATVLDVIDLRTGDLVYTGRTPQRITYILTGGYVAANRITDRGEPVIDIWKVRINPTERIRNEPVRVDADAHLRAEEHRAHPNRSGRDRAGG